MTKVVLGCVVLVLTACDDGSTDPSDAGRDADDGTDAEILADADVDRDADDEGADASVDADTQGDADDSADADEPVDADEPADADARPDADAFSACPGLEDCWGRGVDCSAVIQACLDATPDGGALELPAGQYRLSAQLRLDRTLTLRTQGSEGAPPCTVETADDCARLILTPDFDDRFGALFVTGAATVDHIVVDGNRSARGGTTAHEMCSTLTDNAYGFNGAFQCAGCSLVDSVSMYALCGTGWLVTGPASGVTVRGTTFAYNGRHDVQNMWADGLTVHDAADSTFDGNTFVDNTDIDLIFGGCQRCSIQHNVVSHTADTSGGSFAAIMIHKWPTTSGNYEGVEVLHNEVDCGPARACGSGLYIASEGWYPETPYGTLTPGTTSGRILHNTVVNAMNAIYIAAIGLEIHSNGFLNAHGGTVPSTCGPIPAPTPILISTTMSSCHFGYENVDPEMSVHYSFGVTSWNGCIPNWPF